MSHELRTPLNAVIGFAELVQAQIHGPNGQAKYIEYAGHIEQSGRHLLRLINDVLDLSKVEAGKMELAEDNFSITGLVESSVTTLSPRANKSGTIVETKTTMSVDVCRGDIHRLTQALLNLLSNAIKFTPGGRVAVTTSLDGAGDLMIAVEDFGLRHCRV